MRRTRLHGNTYRGICDHPRSREGRFSRSETTSDYHERSRLIQAIISKAEAGDKSMMRIFEQMGRYLGLGIANLVNLLNPQRVVICQGAIRCAHLFEDSLRSVAEQMVIPPLKRDLEIVIHHWGDEVWARGAASLVLLELDQRGRAEMPKGSSDFRSSWRAERKSPRGRQHGGEFDLSPPFFGAFKQIKRPDVH